MSHDHSQDPYGTETPYDPQARVIAPVIVSTRAATGVHEDLSAPIIAEYAATIGFICRPPVIIPDGEGVLAALSELLVQVEPAVIITSGGTGLTPDDLTPEYTVPLLDKEIPGIMEAVRAHGRSKNVLASLSRGVAGVAEGTVVINLPGSPKAVREGMEVLTELLPHLCDQVADIRAHEDWGASAEQRPGSDEETPA
ncbi:MogA/MoaB family molybdenum cofactor biosynthesis protein [Nesterenkonia alba]|uniref:MogA/MoaB family molybdenum cofactor biosynthesis protein n=1 Tax=Nesterenkonia alba TaxID=515814 RepID=UPI00040929F3|nr:MogA/MoaB family molybdenum cofactor biosynthesis protein [Nesterenkonia alba]